MTVQRQAQPIQVTPWEKVCLVTPSPEILSRSGRFASLIGRLRRPTTEPQLSILVSDQIDKLLYTQALLDDPLEAQQGNMHDVLKSTEDTLANYFETSETTASREEFADAISFFLNRGDNIFSHLAGRRSASSGKLEVRPEEIVEAYNLTLIAQDELGVDDIICSIVELYTARPRLTVLSAPVGHTL